MKFAVCVTFKINPKYWNQFLELMMNNAMTSKIVEDGCLQFDVCRDDAHPYEVFLYEIYTSAEAFDLHLKSEHFLEFDAKVSDMIQEKTVKTFRWVS
ncbi:MAG: putative quinol monooxygenase [Rhizobiaceae bacterium]|nr:putative quinol monooxygenase [Rhizobiaceae bacterium]